MRYKRFASLFLVTAVVGGCTPPLAIDRHAELLLLAAGEARQISHPLDRLKRQLNLADDELNDANRVQARQILAGVADTLRSAKPGELPSRLYIAGWVSISELSRRAKDMAAADVACDAAVAALRSLSPVAERPEYAVGVADEVRALHGKPAAATLLVESAAWAKAIDNVDERRAALTSIADATFDCDDYAGGLADLRIDPDAAWRSDTLAMLANRQLDWVQNVGNGAVPGSIAAPGTVAGGFLAPTETSPASRVSGYNASRAMSPRNTVGGHPYGQSVDYQSVFGSGSR